MSARILRNFRNLNMSAWGRFREFCNRNIIMVVSIPGVIGLHWFWASLQNDDRFVAPHERREFPPVTLFKFAKYYVGLGPMPEKHQAHPSSSKESEK